MSSESPQPDDDLIEFVNRSLRVSYDPVTGEHLPTKLSVTPPIPDGSYTFTGDLSDPGGLRLKPKRS